MRKLLIVILVVLMLLVFVASALPAFAGMGSSGAVGGDPPGWSQQNPGQGGTGSPGPGEAPPDG